MSATQDNLKFQIGWIYTHLFYDQIQFFGQGVAAEPKEESQILGLGYHI